jgi:hypothetical protein
MFSFVNPDGTTKLLVSNDSEPRATQDNLEFGQNLQQVTFNVFNFKK